MPGSTAGRSAVGVAGLLGLLSLIGTSSWLIALVGLTAIALNRAALIDFAADCLQSYLWCRKSCRKLCQGAAPQDYPLPGGGRFTATVTANLRQQQAAVAWLYAECDPPDLTDWREAVARFGLSGAPAHELRSAASAVVVHIDTVKATFRVTHRDEPATSVEGPIVLGSLSPVRLLSCRK